MKGNRIILAGAFVATFFLGAFCSAIFILVKTGPTEVQLHNCETDNMLLESQVKSLQLQIENLQLQQRQLKIETDHHGEEDEPIIMRSHGRNGDETDKVIK